MDDKAIVFHPSAAAEAEAAFNWYHERSLIAARAFILELNQAVEKVSAAPESWPPYENNLRKYVFPRFPFILFYRILNQEIQIIAVAHAKRRPGYWKSR